MWKKLSKQNIRLHLPQSLQILGGTRATTHCNTNRHTVSTEYTIWIILLLKLVFKTNKPSPAEISGRNDVRLASPDGKTLIWSTCADTGWGEVQKCRNVLQTEYIVYMFYFSNFMREKKKITWFISSRLIINSNAPSEIHV